MAKIVDYGYTAPQYYYWAIYDDGSKIISNGATNYVMEIYNDAASGVVYTDPDIFSGHGDEDYWDYPKKKSKESDGYLGYYWEYTYVNGDHPTVSGDGANLTGGTGNDNISNEGNNVEISGGGGVDALFNLYADNVKIYGGTGNDRIDNGNVSVGFGSHPGGNNVTIEGGDGNDDIVNWGEVDHTYAKNVFISGGNGKDTIGNWGGDNATISGGNGKDSINNSGVNVLINGDDGNDIISNDGSNTTINGGNGNDWIYNEGDWNDETQKYEGADNVTIDGGKDNDWIYNNGIDALIDAGDGYDNVENYGAGANITGGKNDDYIYNAMEGSESTIDGGADKDTILNGGNDVKIYGNEDDDSIDNTGNDVTIDGGDNDDKIINSGGSNISINAGGGEKNLVSVTSSSSKVTIEGADTIGVDLIYNESNGALIRGNAGFDDIKNSGVDVYMYGGADDDMLTNYGDNSHIYGESGEDYIYSDNATGIIIDGGANDDDIFAYHDIRALVLGGAGNDRIYMNRVSVADKNELLKELGIDSFSALLSLLKSHPKMGNLQYIPTTIGDWKDWAGEIGSKIIDAVADEKLLIPSIMGSMGNTVKIAKGAQPWITAISAVMTIWKYLDPNSLFQQLNTATSTVSGGKGNDVIVLDGFAPRVVSYSQGDGNDVIYHMATNQAHEERTGNLTEATHLSTLQIESGNIDDVTVNVKDVKLTIGTGAVELIDAAGFRFKVRETDGTLTTRVYGTNEGDTISSYEDEKNLIVDGMSGNDHIYNLASNSTISGNTGNDIISNGYGYVPIPGGLPSVSSGGNNVMLSGGENNDEIYNYYGNNVTIDGGTGNDLIHIEKFFTIHNLITYTDGDGNDIVYGFDSNDTLKISALSYTLERKGFDLIVHVGNGSINLKGCRLLGAIGKVNIDGTPESDLVNVEFYDMQLDADKLSVLKLNPDEVVDVSDAPNEIRIIDASKSQTSVKIIGNSSVDKFTGSDKSDVFYTEPPASQNSSDMMYGMESNAFFASNLLSADSAEDASQIMTVIGGGGDDTIYGGKEKAKLYIYNVNDGNDVIHNFSASDTLSISSNSYSSSKSGDDIIITVGDNSITLNGVANLYEINITRTTLVNETTPADTISTDEVLIIDKDKMSVTLDSKFKIADASKHTKPVQITGNDLDNSIIGGKGNDTLDGTKGKNTLTGGRGKDIFVHNGGNDTITDYEKSKDKISLDSSRISNFTVNDKDLTLAFGDNTSLTLDNMANKQISFLTDSKTNKIIFTENASLDGSGKDATLTSNATEFSALNYPKLKNINAESVSSAFSITGNSKANRIIAGNNDSTLNGGKGKDTLFGGNGTDIFVYNNKSGNKIIQNYSPDDIISLTGAQITDAYIKSNDVILKAGSKKITVKDAASKDIIINEDDTTKFFSAGIIYNQDETSAVITKKFTSKSEKVFDNTVTEIDASNAIKKLVLTSSNTTGTTIYGGRNKDSLTGNSGNDFIYGDKGKDSLYGSAGNDSLIGDKGNDKLFGGTGADSLWGGKGNDTLYGDDGSDTFLYSKGDGKDVIFNFSDDDLLQVSGTFSAYYNSNKNEVSFKVASTSNAITLKDFSASSFNVNGNSYKISGDTLIKK